MAGIGITRTDLTASDLRHAACGEKNARTARRMLAVAQVLDGFDRGTAARTCGLERETRRDWVILYNGAGQDGICALTNAPIPSMKISPKSSTRPTRHGCSLPNDKARITSLTTREWAKVEG